MTKLTLDHRAAGALMAWLCLVAMLAASLCMGIGPARASSPSARIAVQQMSPARSAPSKPNRPCPHSGASQSFGTCAFTGVAGLDQPAIDPTAPVELESSRVALAADSVVTILLKSRLERPPRF